jgi:photosystem II stability/assembly factor-like uncharacterized protein
MRFLLILLVILFTVCAYSEVTWEQFYYNKPSEQPWKIESPDSLDCLVFLFSTGFLKIISSNDGGNNWDTLIDETWSDYTKPAPVPFTPEDMQYPAKNYLYITYIDGVIKASRDRGKTFDTIQLPTTYSLFFLHMADSICGITSTREQIFYTEDGWKTFKEFKFDTSEVKYFTSLWIHSPDKIDFVSCHGLTGQIYYRTTDKGKTWKKIKLNDSKTYLWRIRFYNEKIGWIAGKEKNNVGDQGYDILFKTTDGGDTWLLNYRKENEPVFGLQDVVFTDERNGVAVGQFGKILRTTDGGENWFQEYYTAKPSNGLPLSMVCGKIGTEPIIGVHQRGLLRMPRKTDFVENQNITEEVSVYPNPFNDYVNLKINVPIIDNAVYIEIFSPDGRIIESSQLNNINGNGSIRFKPEITASGIYIYKISSGDKVFTGKMIRK